MNVQHDPEIDGWYRDNAGKKFQVIAVDEESVELQHFGGELEEVTLSVWYALPLEAVDPPGDWTGTFDNVARDDLGDTGQAIHPEEWSGPWEELDRDKY